MHFLALKDSNPVWDGILNVTPDNNRLSTLVKSYIRSSRKKVVEEKKQPH